MKIFVCGRSTDKTFTSNVLVDLLKESENSIAFIQEINHSDNWKNNVEKSFLESDFVLFIIGHDTFTSEQIIWEYAKAKSLNKQIVGYKLHTASNESILFCQGFQVFDNANYCVKFLTKTYEEDRNLKLEQYKIMVSSTEKVTDQRLKVNNLFFTITSSILSVAFVIGKTLEFSLAGTIGMFTLTILSLLVSYIWERLINSYGKLNTGKFKVIDKIEKQLRTNMFEDEWKILREEIDYEPNTKTESNLIKKFRTFIILIIVVETIYLIYQLKDFIYLCDC